MNESRAQAQVIEQHRLGLEVLAEVIKRMMVGQQLQRPQPEQTLTGLGPIVTEVDEGDQTGQDFQRSEPTHQTAGQRMVRCGERTPTSSNNNGNCGEAPSGENEHAEEVLENSVSGERTFLRRLLQTTTECFDVEHPDEETTLMVERLVILIISTKHVNLWMRQLAVKRSEVCELAELMGFEEVKKEIRSEKNLDAWARRGANRFTKSEKGMLFGEIDNVIRNEYGSDIAHWCKRNKVYDEMTANEIVEIWMREEPDDEVIRLNGKHVLETAKRVCEIINTHEDIIAIASFGEYRSVMKKVKKVVKEAHNIERDQE